MFWYSPKGRLKDHQYEVRTVRSSFNEKESDERWDQDWFTRNLYDWGRWVGSGSGISQEGKGRKGSHKGIEDSSQ